MVGLSIVLEAQKSANNTIINPQLINKSTMIKPSPSSSSRSPSLTRQSPSPTSSNWRWSSSLTTTFLDECFLCKQTLLPGKDIYMYKGDKAFCSVDCRCMQISIDEEESLRRENCSFSTKKATSFASSSSSSSSSASASRHHRKGTTRNRAGGFAY